MHQEAEGSSCSNGADTSKYAIDYISGYPFSANLPSVTKTLM